MCPQIFRMEVIMRKIKAITAGILALAMALTMTACEEEVANNSGINPAGDSSETEVTTTNAPKDYVQEAAGQIADQLDNKDLVVDKQLQWMSFWPIDETQAACELFKTAYGVPKYKSDGKTLNDTGKIFEYLQTGWDDRYDKLATAIAGDASPDLFQFELADFPYGVIKGRYNPIDTVVDVDSPKWASIKPILDQYKVNGRYYAAFTEISFYNLMYYRKTMIEEAGLDDPRELFEQGKWDWNSFLDMARKWQQSGENRYVIDGFNPENDFVLSTGVPMIGNDGTKLINNLKNPDVERVMTDLIGVLQSENLRYPRHELNGWSTNPKAWASGEILFFGNGGDWVWRDQLLKYAKKDGWAEDEVRIVPFPKDPQADKHYVFLKQDAYMWIKGSDYADGVAAWYDCLITTSGSPEVREAGIKQNMENYNWSRENLEFMYDMTTLDGSSPLTWVVDFKSGLGKVSDGSACENPIQSLTNLPYLTGDSYIQKREEHNPAIQAAIDEINSYMEKAS